MSALTEEIGKIPRLAMELDGDKDRVEKDKNNDEPIERLRLNNMAHLEPVNQLQTDRC